jgi:branched-chain amino acid transport system substrate-binding protein
MQGRASIRARALAVLVVATFVGFGCNGSVVSKGTIDIGSDMPTLEADAASGLPTQEGAAFAVSQARSVRGFTLKFVSLNDAVNGRHDPVQGMQNVQLMITDRKLLGMVGPLTDDVAHAEIPIANRASLAMISPANHDQCLTLGFTYCQGYSGYTAASLRPTGKNNFFRIAAADVFQGLAMADFAYDELGLKKIAVWDDEEPFGVVMADNFAAEFTKKEGTVVVRQGFDTTTGLEPDFHDWLVRARAAGAEAIYAGATDATYACVARHESQNIFAPSSFYLVPAGIGDPGYYGEALQHCSTDAGAMANDRMYASLGVGDASLNPSAAATIAAYEGTRPNPTDSTAFTFAGYDCAAILIDAIGRAIDANGGKMPTRGQVVEQLAKTTNYQGLTGTYTFNVNGDPTTPTLQILQFKGGAWTPIKNITVAGS